MKNIVGGKKSGSKWTDDGTDLTPNGARGIGTGHGLTETGGGETDWHISLTYLTIDGIDYADGMYFAPGRFSPIQEITATDQIVTGALLGTDSYDWATATITGGAYDGEKITVVHNQVSFINSAELVTYLKAQLGATSVMVSNFYRSANIGANGATSNYTWSLPGGSSYATGSDPASSGFLEYGTVGILSLGDDEVYLINDLTTNGVLTDLDDDEEFSLPPGIVGDGHILAGDNEQSSPFTFTSTGVVTLGADATANVATTDTDGNLCIHTVAGIMYVKNRLGGTRTIGLILHYGS